MTIPLPFIFFQVFSFSKRVSFVLSIYPFLVYDMILNIHTLLQETRSSASCHFNRVIPDGLPLFVGKRVPLGWDLIRVSFVVSEIETFFSLKQGEEHVLRTLFRGSHEPPDDEVHQR